jgi:hypothetical protein
VLTVETAVETVEPPLPEAPPAPLEEDASGPPDENSLPPQAIATSTETSHRPSPMRIETPPSAYPLEASARQ